MSDEAITQVLLGSASIFVGILASLITFLSVIPKIVNDPDEVALILRNFRYLRIFTVAMAAFVVFELLGPFVSIERANPGELGSLQLRVLGGSHVFQLAFGMFLATLLIRLARQLYLGEKVADRSRWTGE